MMKLAGKRAARAALKTVETGLDSAAQLFRTATAGRAELTKSAGKTRGEERTCGVT